MLRLSRTTFVDSETHQSHEVIDAADFLEQALKNLGGHTSIGNFEDALATEANSLALQAVEEQKNEICFFGSAIRYRINSIYYNKANPYAKA